MAEHCQDGPCGVSDEGHASFDEDVGPGLEPPRGLVFWGCIPGEDVLVGGEVRDDRLGVLECLIQDVTNIRAGLAAGTDKLVPFLRLKADGSEPVEERGVGFPVVAVDDHDCLAVGGASRG